MSLDAKLGTGILPLALEVGRFNACRQASFVSKAWGGNVSMVYLFNIVCFLCCHSWLWSFFFVTLFWHLVCLFLFLVSCKPLWLGIFICDTIINQITSKEILLHKSRLALPLFIYFFKFQLPDDIQYIQQYYSRHRREIFL